MRILLLNVPHPSIGSRIPDDHLPPLGLLAIGGPLIDAGFEVRLLDADLEAGRERLRRIWRGDDFGRTSMEKILRAVKAFAPDAILLGHSGSTAAHPVVSRLTRSLRAALPKAWI